MAELHECCMFLALGSFSSSKNPLSAQDFEILPTKIFVKKSLITEVGKKLGLIMIGGLLSPQAVGQRPFKFYQTSFFKATDQ